MNAGGAGIVSKSSDIQNLFAIPRKRHFSFLIHHTARRKSFPAPVKIATMPFCVTHSDRLLATGLRITQRKAGESEQFELYRSAEEVNAILTSENLFNTALCTYTDHRLSIQSIVEKGVLPLASKQNDVLPLAWSTSPARRACSFRLWMPMARHLRRDAQREAFKCLQRAECAKEKQAGKGSKLLVWYFCR